MEGLDNIFGLIVFLVVGGLSMLSQMMAKRKEEERRRNQPRKLDPSELPEATRRMLYGDAPNIPTARPRGQERAEGEPPPLARPARPTVVTFDDEESAPDENTRPSYEEMEARRQAEMQRERELQARIEQQRRQQEAMRRRAEEVRRQAQAAQAAQQAATMQEATRQHRPAAKAQPRGQEPTGAPATPKLQGALNLRLVRQGIILSEILGPPRGLNPY